MRGTQKYFKVSAPDATRFFPDIAFNARKLTTLIVTITDNFWWRAGRSNFIILCPVSHSHTHKTQANRASIFLCKCYQRLKYEKSSPSLTRVTKPDNRATLVLCKAERNHETPPFGILQLHPSTANGRNSRVKKKTRRCWSKVRVVVPFFFAFSGGWDAQHLGVFKKGRKKKSLAKGRSKPSFVLQNLHPSIRLEQGQRQQQQRPTSP